MANNSDNIYVTVSGDISPIYITVAEYYPLISNPAGYITSGNLSGFALKTDLNNSGTVLSQNIALSSGTLQYQIDNLDLNYASQVEFDSLSGKLNNTGSYLYGQITGVSGLLSNYYLKSNPSGFITGITNLTGDFYSRTNPSGFSTTGNLYLTGVTLINQITGLSGNLNQTGSSLLTQINLNTNSGINLSGQIASLSGNLLSTGSNLISSVNNLYNSGVNISGLVTGLDYNNVKTTGNQTITGIKTFLTNVYSSGLIYVSGNSLALYDGLIIDGGTF